jgi:hypothetical protein
MEITVESIAKQLADKIGHGMTEKCLVHAEAIFDVIAATQRITAEKCEAIATTEQKNFLENNCNNEAYGANKVRSEIRHHFNLGE